MYKHVLDEISFALAELVAKGLPEHPEWIDVARGNLDRWERRNADAPGLVHCYREWRAILELPVPEVCRVLTLRDDEGQRLRQSNPFAGVIPQSVVLDIKRRYKDAARAA